MTPRALEAFIHEYRLPFPVAVDRPVPGSPVPATMQRYALRGTPSLLLFDREGRLRLNHFGSIDDMVLGGVIGRLLADSQAAPRRTVPPRAVRSTAAARAARPTAAHAPGSGPARDASSGLAGPFSFGQRDGRRHQRAV